MAPPTINLVFPTRRVCAARLMGSKSDGQNSGCSRVGGDRHLDVIKGQQPSNAMQQRRTSREMSEERFILVLQMVYLLYFSL